MGKPIPGRDYDFRQGRIIRDHFGGHVYPDNPTQNRALHINDVYENHYDYWTYSRNKSIPLMY